MQYFEINMVHSTDHDTNTWTLAVDDDPMWVEFQVRLVAAAMCPEWTVKSIRELKEHEVTEVGATIQCTY